MLPPTDSLQHQNLKLAEFIASARTAQPPPPAYSSSFPEASTLLKAHLTDDDDDDYDHAASRPAPITIHLDASLKIEGHGNTVVLSPSSPSPLVNSSSTPSSSSSSTAPVAPAVVPRTSQTARVEKLTSMVLTALKDAGLLNNTQQSDGETTMMRPVDVRVNAGIVLKGSKNTICTGLPKLLKTADAAAALKARSEGKQGDGGMASENRKRRASSVSKPLLK
jgi:hypothetical protein